MPSSCTRAISGSRPCGNTSARHLPVAQVVTVIAAPAEPPIVEVEGVRTAQRRRIMGPARSAFPAKDRSPRFPRIEVNLARAPIGGGRAKTCPKLSLEFLRQSGAVRCQMRTLPQQARVGSRHSLTPVATSAKSPFARQRAIALALRVALDPRGVRRSSKMSAQNLARFRGSSSTTQLLPPKPGLPILEPG